MTGTQAGRSLVAALFLTTGTLHLVAPGLYRGMMPAYLPAHDALILVSGLAELAGGLGLLLPQVRRAAAAGLLVLLVGVFPANVEMLRAYRVRGGGGWQEALLWGRLPLQTVLMWAVWRLGWQPARREAVLPRDPVRPVPGS